MATDDKLKQYPRGEGGTFDLKTQVYADNKGRYRGVVRIRHYYVAHGMPTLWTQHVRATALRTTKKEARKDAKALKSAALQRNLRSD